MNFKGIPSRTPFRLSEMVDTVEYIRITDSIKVGLVEDIKYCNGRFYLLDKTNKSIWILDDKGHFLADINRQGRANEEYLSLYAFDVNPSNNEVSIYDQTGNKVLVFDSFGNLLRQYTINNDNIEEFYSDFSVLPDGRYLCYNPDFFSDSCRRGLWLDDSRLNYSKNLVTINPEFILSSPTSGAPKYFSRMSNGDIGIMGGEDNNNIFHISPTGEITIAYHISTDAQLPLSLTKMSDAPIPVLKSAKFYHKYYYAETDHWIFIVALNGDKFLRIFYDKRRHIGHQVRTSDDSIDDVNLGDILRASDGKLLSVFEPDELKDKGIELWQDIRSDSNPTIAVAYMK